jgi:hypothetical protein
MKGLDLCESVDKPDDCIIADIKKVAEEISEKIGAYVRIDMFISKDVEIVVQEYTTNHMGGLRHCSARKENGCIDSCFLGKMWKDAGGNSTYGGPSTGIPQVITDALLLEDDGQCAMAIATVQMPKYSSSCSSAPSSSPSSTLSGTPSRSPSVAPVLMAPPTAVTTSPSQYPSATPSVGPSMVPSGVPSLSPLAVPSWSPSQMPSLPTEVCNLKVNIACVQTANPTANCSEIVCPQESCGPINITYTYTVMSIGAQSFDLIAF